MRPEFNRSRTGRIVASLSDADLADALLRRRLGKAPRIKEVATNELD
jgi:hypothetical protein